MHPNHAPALIQEAIADAMPIIHDVIVKELHENPSVLLGQEAWDSLLNEARVYKEAEKVCRSSFDGITWGTDALKNSVEDFQCPNCSSSLLRNDNVNATIPSELRVVCSKCSEAADTEDVIEAAIKESLYSEIYLSQTQGGEEPLQLILQLHRAEDVCP